MYRKMDDLLGDLESESALTQKLLDVLTDASLSQTVVDGHRTLGRIAWHIVTTVAEMMVKTGVMLKAVHPDAPVPGRAAEIRQAYASVVGELIEQIRSGWTDETLMKVDDMYGHSWPRGVSAQVLLSHQIHHRGQMTVLMRQAGLKVPGVYGPAKEEWSGFGAPPPEV